MADTDSAPRVVFRTDALYEIPGGPSHRPHVDSAGWYGVLRYASVDRGRSENDPRGVAWVPMALAVGNANSAGGFVFPTSEEVGHPWDRDLRIWG